MPPEAFSALTAAERAAALVDSGTLRILAGDGERSSLVTACGRIDGRDVFLALTDGQVRGGTIGRAEAREFTGLLAAAARRRSALVVGWDTGGVRVQEGPAALAAASAVGVAVARHALLGAPVVSLISGARGCFGAPAVIAAAGHATLLADDALWGLTGPQLLERAADVAADAREVMGAAYRRRAGHATAAVRGTPAALRLAVARALASAPQRGSGLAVLDRSLAVIETLHGQLPPEAAADDDRRERQRDFFAYSFRGRWKATGPVVRLGHVHSAWGELAGTASMAIIVGPQRSPRGFGVADARAVLRAVRHAVATAPGAPIVTFLFCRGHASDIQEERAGLPRALAECLRGLVAARLLGHPLLCVLGGGAYGAAYLTLAAPSHRVLAIRGTSIAPMAPRVLAAFQNLRGVRAAADTPPDLAELIPEIRIVESVVRLPRALGDELTAAREAVAASGRRRWLYAAA